MEERRGAFILTFTGTVFWPLDPRPEEIHVEDIAHALANLCRYTGHSRKFYSVAEHSCHVSDSSADEYRLWGLLHDAPEAYLGDLARPTKQAAVGFGEAYQIAERRLMRAVCKRFGLPPEEPIETRALDDVVLENEVRVLMPKLPGGGRWTTQRPRRGLEIGCWSPRRSEREFLTRFYRLYEGA